MSKGRVWAGFAALACALVLVAGCGSDDESSDAISKKELVAQANSICEKSSKEMQQRVKQMRKEAAQGKTVSEERQDEVLLSMFAPYGEAVEEVKSLGTPEGDNGEAEAVVKTMENAQREFEADPTLVLADAVMDDKDQKLVSSYGLASCTF